MAQKIQNQAEVGGVTQVPIQVGVEVVILVHMMRMNLSVTMTVFEVHL